MRRQSARPQGVDHDHAVWLEEPPRRAQCLHRILRSLEMADDPRERRECEAIAARCVAHVTENELDATIGTSGAQIRIRFDAGIGPRKERGGAIDADDVGRPALEERAEETARPTSQVDDPSGVETGELAVEAEIPSDLVVLEVVELGQCRGVR